MASYTATLTQVGLSPFQFRPPTERTQQGLIHVAFTTSSAFATDLSFDLSSSIKQCHSICTMNDQMYGQDHAKPTGFNFL